MTSTFASEINPRICQLVREAGQKAMHLREIGFQVDQKGFDDYVTNVDRELDGFLSQKFQDWFPNDVIISEENSHSITLWKQTSDTNHRFWLIDPIDGTDDFIYGREFYSVMVGLLEAFQPVMGWVYAPKSDRLYFGGTAINSVYLVSEGNAPQVLNISPPTGKSCDRLIVSKKDDIAYGNAIRLAVPNVNFYSLGSFGLKVMEVVQGHASAYIYLNRRVKLWDTVGPLAIAKAAGLVCCDLTGQPVRFGYGDVEADTLTHNQVIIIGWQGFINEYLEAIAKQVVLNK
ncbi:MAG: inositol monophosphatase [Oscillatoriales cyanobacterium CG2_30_44_21]|nr:MAG: inositol monophosphatase [Oscillatoriales cyanobacterium CG2_30_44_21]